MNDGYRKALMNRALACGSEARFRDNAKHYERGQRKWDKMTERQREAFLLVKLTRHLDWKTAMITRQDYVGCSKCELEPYPSSEICNNCGRRRRDL